MNSVVIKLWNFVQFQIGWFALVLSAAQGNSLPGIVLVTVFIAVHLVWIARPGEWLLLLILGLLGWLWESLFHAAGLIGYAGYSGSALTAPFWMAMFWLNFAAVLNHSLAWLQSRYLLAGLLGGVGGPLAYWGGSLLNAAVLPNLPLALFVQALAWVLLMPLSLLLAERLCHRPVTLAFSPAWRKPGVRK